MRARDIFTPGDLPGVTYITDHLAGHADTMMDSLESNLVVTLSGPSKSGKTVFVEKTIGQGLLVPVSGAGVTSPNDLWARVFAIIGTPLPGSATETNGFQGAAGAKIEGQIPFLVKGEANTTGTWSNSTTYQTGSAVDYLSTLIKEVGDTGLVIFVDDFHYVSLSSREEISNQIKHAASKRVRFVIAAVPYHADEAVKANSDLRGRAIKLDFNYWRHGDLLKIATLGFDALNINIPLSYIQALADEAAGSPQLMQALCLNTCYELGVRVRPDEPFNANIDLDLIARVCTRTAQTTDYTTVVTLIKEGPKTRGTERTPYLLNSGEIFDVYPLLIKAIAQNPPELTIRYSNLQQRINQLCANQNPSGSSVTGACGHVCAIANASAGRTILEWDAQHDVLDILDPYLLFFIRWGDR